MYDRNMKNIVHNIVLSITARFWNNTIPDVLYRVLHYCTAISLMVFHALKTCHSSLGSGCHCTYWSFFVTYTAINLFNTTKFPVIFFRRWNSKRMGHENTKVAIIPNPQVPLIGFQKSLFVGNWDDFLKPRM